MKKYLMVGIISFIMIMPIAGALETLPTNDVSIQ